jgi:hypothetical protein
MAESDGDYVPITGIVHLHTTLGVFLEIQGRSVFVPDVHMEPARRRYAPGEISTLRVRRSFAKQEGLVTLAEGEAGGRSPRST